MSTQTTTRRERCLQLAKLFKQRDADETQLGIRERRNFAGDHATIEVLRTRLARTYAEIERICQEQEGVQGI